MLTVSVWRMSAMANPPADNFETQNTDWKREGLLRGSVGHMTFKGQQFNIYAPGQSLQVARGETNVTGEAMIEAVVARTLSPGSTPPIYYRPLYFRYLSE